MANCGGCVETENCGYCLSTLSCDEGSEKGPHSGNPCPNWVYTDHEECPGKCHRTFDFRVADLAIRCGSEIFS